MADKSFGVKDINLIGASGTPTIDSPNNLNINAVNVAISTDITVAGKVSLGTGTSISSPAANTLTLGTNNAESLRVTSDGDVGIGDNAPDSTYGTNLSVHSTASDGARLKISDGFSGKGNNDGFDLISTSSEAFLINRENADMSFSTNNTTRLRLAADGSIGTKGLTPSDGSFCVNSTIRSQNSSSNISYMGFTGYTGNSTVGSMFSYMGGDGRNTGYLNFSTNDTERLRITSAGVVGINTTTGFDTSVGLAVRNGQSGSDHTMIDIIANTNETSRVVFSDDADHNQGRIQYNHNVNSLGFYTNGNNERLHITSAGEVLKPGQPMAVCFAVTSGSKTVSANSSTTLIPAGAGSVYDPNGDLNLSTGAYTVPVAGRYLVFYGTEGKTSTNANAGSIYYNLNGGGLGGQCLYYGAAYGGASKQVILNLSENDSLVWQLYGNNGQNYGINNAAFGIYLIG